MAYPFALRSLLLLALAAAVGCDGGDDPEPVAPVAPGLVVVESSRSVSATFDAIDEALQAAPPISVVARIDHAQSAQSAGLSLRPTRVLLFGNPALGTPIMQANQVAGIDLPQKMLVYEDAGGATFVVYNGPTALAARHRARDVSEETGMIRAALDGLAATAAGQ